MNVDLRFLTFGFIFLAWLAEVPRVRHFYTLGCVLCLMRRHVFFIVLLILFYSFFLSVSFRFQRLPCDSVPHEASWYFFSPVFLLCFRLVSYTCFSDYPAWLPAFCYIHHYRLQELQ